MSYQIQERENMTVIAERKEGGIETVRQLTYTTSEVVGHHSNVDASN